MSEKFLDKADAFDILAGGVASSELVPADEWSPVLASAKGDVRQLAMLLDEKGLLTRFQIREIIAGRGSSLRVGNYDILDRLGAGGMGTVFKARHRRMKRIVALKVLAASLSQNPVFVKRFQREVETIACLGHPNVVMAYDADEANVGHFLVMEFVNGLDLAACVERSGPMSVAKAVDCILQSARGLAYAHSQGIVHRDVKPQNLLLAENGVVKVTDLGLARLNHGAEGPASGTDVTMAGGVIGTADYMPPEQAVDSTTIDHRADIYSLGCTLYFLLAGKPPFSASTIIAILLRHRDAEIPSLSAIGRTPLRLENLFQRMMAKQPDGRVQQMSEVVVELEQIASALVLDAPSDARAGETSVLVSGIGALSGIDMLPDSTISASQMHAGTMELKTTGVKLPVLIVEPSRVQASIIRNFLEEHSLSVVGNARNVKEAIDMVRTHRPRAVISAMYLADANGVELAQQIRSEFAADAPGFVLITSEEQDGESASLSRLNRVLMLAKPFNAEQLIEAINLVTGASGVQKSAVDSGGVIPQKQGKKDRNQLQVMIVDDSTAARMHIRTTLQTLGFSKFFEVSDGAYAIAMVAREVCDLIVTDYNMPLMDGRALVSYLKHNPATAAIPIVMVTTETDPRVIDPVRKLGVAAVIEKAFPTSVVGPLLDLLF